MRTTGNQYPSAGLVGLLAAGAVLSSSASGGPLCGEGPSVEVNRFGYGFIVDADPSPDGIHVAVASSAGITIWNTKTGTAERLLLTHNEQVVRTARWSPDGTRLAGRDPWGTVLVWSAEDGSVLHALTGHRSAVESVVWSPDGTQFASASFESNPDHLVGGWRARANPLSPEPCAVRGMVTRWHAIGERLPRHPRVVGRGW